MNTHADKPPARSGTLTAKLRTDGTTYWHRAALSMFRAGANTIGIATALNTTEADAYNLVAQARETERASRG